MSLTAAQQQAAYAPGSVSVTAGAGTGKTHMLAERYLHHLRSGVSPLEIVAVTFTDKAAAELRSRIRHTVTTQAQERSDWLAELEAAQISTFHALAARICREHPDAANVPADFVLLDNIEGALWQAEQRAIALDTLSPDLYAQVPYSLMHAALEAFLNDPLSANDALQRNQSDWVPVLNQLQYKACDRLFRHLDWQNAKAIVNQNMGKAGDKLETLRQTVVDLMDQLENTAEDSQSESFQTALKSLLSLKVGNVGGKANWDDQETLTTVRQTIIALREFVKHFTDTPLLSLQITELDQQTEACLPTLRTAFEQVRSHLSSAKQQQRVLDFNDLEVHALMALTDASVREYYAQRWRVFLIDEFQDTNPTQGQLLELLAQQAILTLVGDEKQSIYGFRRPPGAGLSKLARSPAPGGRTLHFPKHQLSHPPTADRPPQSPV